MSGESIALLILAGGKSVRFGCTKALFDFDGQPLIVRMIQALGDMTERIVVAVAPGQSEQFAEVVGETIEIVEDRERFMGPLIGLKDALDNVSQDIVMLAPCDMPFISSQLYSLLLVRLGNADAAVPIFRGYPEPMTGVYRAERLKHAVRAEMNRGGRKLSGIMNHLNSVILKEDDWMNSNLDISCFTNLNNPP